MCHLPENVLKRLQSEIKTLVTDGSVVTWNTSKWTILSFIVATEISFQNSLTFP